MRDPLAPKTVPALTLYPDAVYLIRRRFRQEAVLASPFPSRQLPVVSAFTRAKDSLTALRSHIRSLSKISYSQTSRRGGTFFFGFLPCSPAQESSLAIGVDGTDRSSSFPEKTYLAPLPHHSCLSNRSKTLSQSLTYPTPRSHLCLKIELPTSLPIGK